MLWWYKNHEYYKDKVVDIRSGWGTVDERSSINLPSPLSGKNYREKYGDTYFKIG